MQQLAGGSISQGISKASKFKPVWECVQGLGSPRPVLPGSGGSDEFSFHWF